MLALLFLPYMLQVAAQAPGDADAVRGTYPEPPHANARYVTRFGLEFHPTITGGQFLPAPAPSIRCGSGSPFRYYDSWFTLPNGANLRFVDIFGHDSSPAEDMNFTVFNVCQPPLGSPGSSVNNVLGSVSTAGVSGDFVRVIDLSTEDHVIEANRCKVLVRFRFTAEGSTCPAQVMAVDKVRLLYSVDP